MIKILAAVVVLGLVAVFIINTQEKNQGSTNSSSVVTENNEPTEQSDIPGKTDKTASGEPVLNSTGILDLSGQGLRKTPSYVFEKTDIQKLDLSNNNLDGSLQAEVRQLQNLKVLDLSNNQFTGVPAEIGQLKNLEVLNLSTNQLTGLPYELGNLSNLKVLDIRGNNYAPADLEIIKKNLPPSTEILTN